MWQLVKREIRKTVSNLGVCDFHTIGRILPYSDETILEEEVEAPVAIQTNDWACGIHAVLNGWAQAMKLTINTSCIFDEETYRMSQ